MALGLVLASSVLQGCVLAVAAVGAVGVDEWRRTDVEFDAFENSWVAPAAQRPPAPLHTVAIVAFPDEARLAAHLSSILAQRTDLQVLTPDVVTARVPAPMLDAFDQVWTEDQLSDMCGKLSVAVGADSALFGRVVEGERQERGWPWKTRQPNRLYVYLVSADGRLIWKDELPYTVIRGSKELEAEFVEHDLATRLTAHSTSIGLGHVLRLRPDHPS